MVMSRKIHHQENADRAARTRTLIQLGGILQMLGIATQCDIDLGEDLQLDPTAQEKAATLIGLLLTWQDSTPLDIPAALKETYHNRGVRFLKQHAYKNG